MTQAATQVTLAKRLEARPPGNRFHQILGLFGAINQSLIDVGQGAERPDDTRSSAAPGVGGGGDDGVAAQEDGVAAQDGVAAAQDGVAVQDGVAADEQGGEGGESEADGLEHDGDVECEAAPAEEVD